VITGWRRSRGKGGGPVSTCIRGADKWSPMVFQGGKAARECQICGGGNEGGRRVVSLHTTLKTFRSAQLGALVLVSLDTLNEINRRGIFAPWARSCFTSGSKKSCEEGTPRTNFEGLCKQYAPRSARGTIDCNPIVGHEGVSRDAFFRRLRASSIVNATSWSSGQPKVRSRADDDMACLSTPTPSDLTLVPLTFLRPPSANNDPNLYDAFAPLSKISQSTNYAIRGRQRLIALKEEHLCRMRLWVEHSQAQCCRVSGRARVEAPWSRLLGRR